MNLTDDEIKSLIRKSQGWTELKEGPNQYGWERGDEWHYLHQVPNYPLDLNACAEFEATLTHAELRLYGHELGRQTECMQWYNGYISVFGITVIARATARQRCLAYLKTKGLILCHSQLATNNRFDTF